MTQVEQAREWEWRRWSPVLLLWTCFCLAYMARQSLYSTFPLLRLELGFTEAQLGLTTTVFSWVYGIAGAFGGKLGDLVSRKRVILFSLAGWSAALALTALASTPGALLTGRSAMALAQSFYIPAALAIIGSLHSPATRARAITLHGTAQGSGVILGGYYGAVVSEGLGWRPMLGILAAATVAYALVVRWFLRTGDADPAAPAATAAATKPAGFSLWQLFAIPTFSLIALCSVAVGANVWMLYTWLPDLLRERFHLPIAQASLLATSSIEVPMFVGLILGAFGGDRLARGRPVGRLYLMCAGLGAACACFFFIGAGATLWAVQGATVAYAVCKGFYTANYIACIFEVVPVRARAFSVGVINMTSGLGGSLSPYLLGALKPVYGTVGVFGGISVFGVTTALTLALLGLRRFQRDQENQQRI